jgi:hypothetical protein
LRSLWLPEPGKGKKWLPRAGAICRCAVVPCQGAAVATGSHHRPHMIHPSSLLVRPLSLRVVAAEAFLGLPLSALYIRPSPTHVLDAQPVRHTPDLRWTRLRASALRWIATCHVKASAQFPGSVSGRL